MEIVFSCLLVIYMVFLLLIVRTWSKIPPGHSGMQHSFPGVTIVIAVRNEENNLKTLIESLKALRYPEDKLEVILVDDASEDGTRELLKEYTDQAVGFRWIALKEPADFRGSYKKRALTHGIGQAKHDLIVTTDADCQFHPDWLTIMVSTVQNDQLAMSTGPVLYRSTRWTDTLLNIELASLVAIGAASLEKGYPNMCNGANLIFSRQCFNQVEGYLGYEEVISGDDEFLLYKMHKAFPGRVRFVKHPRAVVKTDAPQSWKEFLNQRKRWSGKWRKHESWSTRILAIFIYIFHLTFFGVIVLSVCSWYSTEILCIQVILKLMVEMLLAASVLRFMDKRVGVQWYLIMQLLYSIYVLVVGLAVHLTGFTWKNRKYQ